MGTKFVVLMTGRSGSVWLMSTLNSFQHVTAHGALFRRKDRSPEKKWDSDFARPRFIETKSNGLPFRPFSVFSYLNDLYDSPDTIGFKLNYAQLGLHPEILAYLIKHRVRVVHLIRRNHLDVVISYEVKAKIGQAHVLSGQSAPNDIQVELDTENMIRRFTWMEKRRNLARKLLSWCRLPHLEVAYEDLLRDPNHFDNVFNFLAIESDKSAPQASTVKIRKGSHRDVISNYEEVKEVLEGSKFAGLLE